MARSLPTLSPHEETLLRDERSQAVRIPAACAFPEDRIRISRDGGQIIQEPSGRKDLLDVLAALGSIEEGFPDLDAMLPPLDDDRL